MRCRGYGIKLEESAPAGAQPKSDSLEGGAEQERKKKKKKEGISQCDGCRERRDKLCTYLLKPIPPVTPSSYAHIRRVLYLLMIDSQQDCGERENEVLYTLEGDQTQIKAKSRLGLISHKICTQVL